MGVSWQTADQKKFFEEHTPSYLQHVADETVKTLFWPGIINKWFEMWPNPEPSPELVTEHKTAKEAEKNERAKKITVSLIWPPPNQL